MEKKKKKVERGVFKQRMMYFIIAGFVDCGFVWIKVLSDSKLTLQYFCGKIKNIYIL